MLDVFLFKISIQGQLGIYSLCFELINIFDCVHILKNKKNKDLIINSLLVWLAIFNKIVGSKLKRMQFIWESVLLYNKFYEH